MHKALEKAVPASELDWSDMRWDSVDVTARWSQDRSHRNIHGWLDGSWPAFSLRFEGSAWDDDEANLRRRVVFFSGPITTLSVTEGGTAEPKIEISDQEGLAKDVRELVERLQKVQMRDVPWAHRLRPLPDRRSTPLD